MVAAFRLYHFTGFGMLVYVELVLPTRPDISWSGFLVSCGRIQ